jgi:hypothetical protein
MLELDLIQFKLNQTYQAWGIAVFFMIYLVINIAVLIRYFRSNFVNKWIIVSFSVLIYLVCVGIAISTAMGSREIAIEYLKRAQDNSSRMLCKDWGDNFSIQKRRDISLEFASHAFWKNGVFRDYFDLQGNIVEFKPNETDWQIHSKFLATLEQLNKASDRYMWIVFGWLLVPIIGIALGFLTKLSSK